MEAKYFQDGNYIYECKTSPSQIGGYFDSSYLNSSIKSLRKRWENGKLPSGYRYVFPVNYLDEKGQEAIAKLQKDFPNVDIRYYDQDQVENLILSLEKINNFDDLINYVKQVRGESE